MAFANDAFATAAREIRSLRARTFHPRRVGGEQRCQFDGRTIAVDDDSFLILNNGRVCTTQIDSARPVESFAIDLRRR